jgi:hypothetical protein
MSDWQKVWDHEFAGFGRRSFVFPSADGTYQIDVDDKSQDQVVATYKGERFPWVVWVKEVCNGTFRLQGMTFGSDAFLGDTFWYELTLSAPCVIRYYGNQVLVSEDREVNW